MICCHSCPFNPANITENEIQTNNVCQQPECLSDELCNSPEGCNRVTSLRCHLDGYVIRNLCKRDHLAELLAPSSLDKACKNRDRSMILKIFQQASDYLKTKLFKRLESSLEKNLATFNPIFASAGLPPIKSFYSEAKTDSPYFCAVCDNESVYQLLSPVKFPPDMFSNLINAFKENDHDFLCELIRLSSTDLRSRLLKFMLIFHSEKMYLFNPIYEKNELAPLEPFQIPEEKTPYMIALLSENA
ncbi:MAG: hypothetical protein HQM10_04550 [Candidatus Riflebacteria bacterium]|nr:hypothetical protein [Candidatus Riflebacteria bacterium]